MFLSFWQKILPNRFRGNTDTAKILDNTFWLFLDKGIKMITGLFVGAWVTRYLGEEQFGQLTNATAIMQIAGAFALLGLDGIILRELIRQPEKKGEYLGTAFVLRLAGGFTVAVLTLGTLWLLTPDDRLTMALVGILCSSFVFQSLDTIDLYFQSQLLSKYTILSRTLALVLASSLKIYLILTEKPLIYFALALSVEYGLAGIAMAWAYRWRGLRFQEWRFVPQLAPNLLKESWTLMFSAIFVLINMKVDKIMLRYMSSDAEAGIYGAASQLSELWYFLPVFLGNSLMPKLIEAHKESLALYERKLQTVFSLMTFLALLIAVPTTFLSERIIELIFGSRYAASAPVLSIHIWSAVFIFHVSLRTKALIIEKIAHFVGTFSLFVMFSNVLFNALLIPSFQSAGAAWASLLSWALSATVVPLFFAETRSAVPMFWRSLVVWNYRKIWRGGNKN
jgi:polysaccharide transporter, PST family